MAEDSFNSDGLSPSTPPTAPDEMPIGVARGIDFSEDGVGTADPMLLSESTAGRAAVDVVMFLGALFISVLVVGLMAGVAQFLWGEIDQRWLQVFGLPVQGAIWVGLVAGMLALRGQSARSIGACVDRLGVNGLLGLATWGLAFGSHALGLVLVWLVWSSGFEALQHNTQNIQDMLPRLHPVFLVGLQCVVGIYEEVVFRGFLLTRLRKALGSWWLAVPVSSAIFAAPHAMNQVTAAVVPLFMLGCTLSLMTIWRRSLIPAIIGHALLNSGTLVYLYYLSPDWQ